MLASAFAADPPENLARLVAENETRHAEERMNYTYRQSVRVDEFGKRGTPAGFYTEVRDIIFSPESGRSEEFVKKPLSRLKRLQLTEEDFQDIREVQPFLFTKDQLWAYETRYEGEETLDGVTYWVLMVRPRQTFQGQRLFDGVFWVDQQDLSVARAMGRAVPSIFGGKSENLFPEFTTVRTKVDGKFWFPMFTYADDVLPFRTGPLRMRMRIEYSNYKRFAAESSITFEPDSHSPPN
ncbi:MAG: hypothetical protein GY953_42545 [bacterium]|nr:hypothetical protein [bacterium]